MVKLIWIATLIALLLWSLLTWTSGVLLTGSADFLAAQAAAWAPWAPEAELALATATAWLERFGSGALWLLWAVGALLLLLGAWLASATLQALQRAAQRIAPDAAQGLGLLKQRLLASRWLAGGRGEAERYGA